MNFRKGLISLLVGSLLFGEGCLYPDKRIYNPQLKSVQIYFTKDETGKLKEGVIYNVEDNLSSNVRSRAVFYDDGFDGELDRVQFYGQMNGESFYMGLEKGDKDMERLVRVFSKTRVLAEKDERYCDGQLENWYFDVRNKYLNGSKE